MDPVTIATAAITFLEASVAIGKGAKALRSLSHSSAEFCELLDELDHLHAFLDQSRDTIEEISDPASQLSDGSKKRVSRLQLDLSQAVNELSALSSDMVASSKGLNKEGKHKIPTAKWQREKGRAVRLRGRCCRARQIMADFFPALNASQLVHSTRLLKKLDGRELRAAERNEQLVATVLQRIDAFEAMFSSTVAVQKARPSSQVRVAQGPEARDDESPLSPAREGCGPICGCQCHRISSLRSPVWLRTTVGSFVVRFNGLPGLDARHCNLRSCRSGSNRSLRLRIDFPTWLLGRALCLSASWGSLTNVGAAMFIKIPRATDLGRVYFAAGERNITYLRHAIETKRLLPNDVDENDGEPLLAYCTRSGHWGVISFLLSEGFDPLLPDAIGLSASDWARHHSLSSSGLCPSSLQARVLKQLANFDSENYICSPSLIRDSIIGDRSLVGGTPASISLRQALDLEPHMIDSFDEYGRTPLHWAIDRQDSDAVRMLLENGADPNLSNKHDARTPLRVACSFCRPEVSIVEALLEFGAEVNRNDTWGGTPLHHCIGDLVSVSLLLQKGANPKYTDKNRNTALHVASFGTHTVRGSWTDIVAKMVAAGADLESTDIYGRSPLLTAAMCNAPCLFRALSRCGGQVDVSDEQGFNVLHFVAFNCDLDMMQCLRWELDLELDPDAKDIDGMSPMTRFQLRMDFEYVAKHVPTASPLTQLEVFTFSALVVELREKNWAQGRYLDSKERVEANGEHKALKRWLGKQYLRLFCADDVDFGNSLWDWDRDDFCGYWDWETGEFSHEEELLYEEDEDENDRIFGSGLGGFFGEDISEEEEDEVSDECNSELDDEDEFFDAFESVQGILPDVKRPCHCPIHMESDF